MPYRCKEKNWQFFFMDIYYIKKFSIRQNFNLKVPVKKEKDKKMIARRNALVPPHFPAGKGLN